MAKKYIELEAAIMAIEKPKVTPGGVIFDALKKACQEEVRNLPTADVAEVRHGHWIDKAWTTEDDWGCYNHRVVICSVCNKQFDYIIKEKSKYCPNCGAKMDGVINK